MKTLILLLLLSVPLQAQQFEELVVGEWEANIVGIEHITLMKFGADGRYVITYINQRTNETILWSVGSWEMREIPMLDPALISVEEQIAQGALPIWNFCLNPLTEAGNSMPAVCSSATLIDPDRGNLWIWPQVFLAYPRGKSPWRTPYSNNNRLGG